MAMLFGGACVLAGKVSASASLGGLVAVRCMAVKSGTTGKKRFRLPANSQAQYLVNNVSGSNIFKEGADVPLKDDAEYPDWIWTMRLSTPPKAADMEPGTREYWRQLAHESNTRLKRFMSVRHKTTMRVGQVEKQKMEWQERIKYRALASTSYEPGFNADDINPNQPSMKLWLRPQPDDEVIYADQYVREHREKFFKYSFQEDVRMRRTARNYLKGYQDPTGGVKSLPREKVAQVDAVTTASSATDRQDAIRRDSQSSSKTK